MTTTWSEHVDNIAKLHELPIFLPNDFIRNTLIPAMAVVAMSCTLFYFVALYVVRNYGPKAVNSVKIAYQLTNVTFNLCVGLVGVYLEYKILPTLPCFHSSNSVDRIPWNHEELYLVSAMQLGYQIWAIPVGVLTVGESMQMIAHHFAVVISTFQSGFMTVGFRYYTPFFYGVMELSSLPLSLMNAFKDHPHWIKQRPIAYLATRVVFAVTFIVIRVVMCAPKWIPFLFNNFIFLYTAEMGFYKMYILVQWSLAAFLASLQLYWATLILRGLVKLVIPTKKKKKKA